MKTALRSAVALAPDSRRAEAAQEAIDIFAVRAALKPVAILGRGNADAVFVEAACEAAVEDGLQVTAGPYWRIEASLRGLPGWYRAIVSDAGAEVRFITLPGVGGMPPPDTAIDVAVEADWLGYPSCCVREFHRKRRLFHRFILRALHRQTGGAPDAMARLAKARVVPTPRTAAERRALLLATRMPLVPYTSVTPCRSCEAGPESPTERLAARYRKLAMETDLASGLLGGTTAGY